MSCDPSAPIESVLDSVINDEQRNTFVREQLTGAFNHQHVVSNHQRPNLATQAVADHSYYQDLVTAALVCRSGDEGHHPPTEPSLSEEQPSKQHRLDHRG
jgi:hypothetical protein